MCHQHCNCHTCVKAMVPTNRNMSPIPSSSPRRYSTTFPPSPEIYTKSKRDFVKMEQQREGSEGLGPIIGSSNHLMTVKREAGATSTWVKPDREVSSVSLQAPSDKAGKNILYNHPVQPYNKHCVHMCYNKNYVFKIRIHCVQKSHIRKQYQ